MGHTKKIKKIKKIVNEKLNNNKQGKTYFSLSKCDKQLNWSKSN